MFTVDPSLAVLDDYWGVAPFVGGDAGFVSVRAVAVGQPLGVAWEASVFAQRKFVLTITVRSS